MRTIAIILLLFSIIPYTIKGQVCLKKMKLYNTWVKTMTPEKIKHIYTYEINKEDITVVSKHLYEKDNIISEADLSHIAVDNINVISFRKKGDVWKGALIGTASAFIVGCVVGIILDSGYDPGESGSQLVTGLVVGGILAPAGLAIGSSIGSLKSRFQISGNQEYYDQVREGIKKRSIRYYYD